MTSRIKEKEIPSSNHAHIALSSPQKFCLQIGYNGFPLSHSQIFLLLDTILSSLHKKKSCPLYSIEAKSGSKEVLILLQSLSESEVTSFLARKEEHEAELLKLITSPATSSSINSLAYLEAVQDKTWHHLKELLIHISKRFSNISVFELLEESLRIYLATDNEFKKIRPFTALARLILSHYFLRKSWSVGTEVESESLIKTRLWKNTLIFPFGKQKVLSLAISIRSLSSREKFELHHILSACHRIIPSLRVVPYSFYFYQHSKDLSWNFYVELEKNPKESWTSQEMNAMKSHLDQELASSIEQVANRIDIPYNEEEILRTIHTLSRELKTKNALPQVLIQFQRQLRSSIQFTVYVLRVMCEEDIQKANGGVKATTIGMVQLRLQRQEIVGQISKKYVKLLQLFEVHCDKKQVMRSDCSLNFIKAREQVLYAIRLHFGPVRDVNGGFWAQQRDLLYFLKSALPITPDEREEQFLEQLVRGVNPSPGRFSHDKNGILCLASLLITLNREQNKNPTDDLIHQEAEEALYLVAKKHPNMSEDELLQILAIFSLDEREVFYSFVSHDEMSYACFAILSPNIELRKRVLQWIASLLSDCALRLKRQQGIRICLPRPTRWLDPRIGTDRTSGAVIKMLYEGLMRLSPENKPELALAKSYTISPDGKEYTFHLRPSYWSNGEPLFASDFEYAWKKILDPSLKTLFSHLFLPIKNAQSVKDGLAPLDDLGVKALGAHTLFVELEKPYPYFLELLTHWMYSPLCQATDLVHPGWACFGAEQHVCNGPFKLSKWKQDAEIEAVKNEWYWNKSSVLIDRIHMKIIEDPKLAWRLFLKGDIDWIGEPLSQLPSFITKSPPPGVGYHQTNGVQWFALNTASPLFSNKNIRQAFSLAVNRSKIIDSCRFQKERMCHSILPKQLSVLDPDDPLCYSPEQAIKLFYEGLAELNLPNEPITLKMRAYDAEFLLLISRQAIRDWEELFPIRIELEVVEWHRFFDSLPKSQYDIVSIAWYSWFNHALYTFETLSSKANSMNIAKWENSQFQQLIHDIVFAQSDTDRSLKIGEAEKLLIEEMPIIPVFEYFSQYATNNAVENIFVSPLGNVDFRWAFVHA